MADHPPFRRSDGSDPRNAVETGKVRAQTDSGMLGDKIPVSDPATAPLGPDAEASGARPIDQATPAVSDAAPSRWPQGHRGGPVPGAGINVSAALIGFLAVVLVGGAVLYLLGAF